jgi:hypothetical protein
MKRNTLITPRTGAAALAACLIGATTLVGQTPTEVTVQGGLTEQLSGQPIQFAIVRVAGTDISTLTDSRGHYLVHLPPGTWQLEFRRIGYRMATVSVSVGVTGVVRDVVMARIPMQLADITVSARGDSRATQIIREAIARKNDVLSRIHDYQYDAYVKLLIFDMNKPRDSVESVMVITETQTTAYWEQPDRYQETIKARRQSRNLPADDNLVSVGEIVNFNKNRIDLTKYAVVSPTADDALSHYHYQLVDSLEMSGRRVYRLAIEPRTEAEPLFVGMIDIADSTFDVVSIDVGANDAIRFDLFDNLRYQQTLAPVGDDYWMPEEIRFTGEIHFGVPLPGIPRNLEFQHVASLDNFRFDEGNAPSNLGEFLIVVDERADDMDSTSWSDYRASGLTALEENAYARIDSIENVPPSWSERVLGGTLGLAFLAFNPDFFHFNRVEGPYLGTGATLRDLSPDVILRAKAGRSFGLDRWQYAAGASYRLSETHRIWVGGSIREEVVWRPTMVGDRTNATVEALLYRTDPLDYYREKGFSVFVSGRVANFTTLRLQYNDFEQHALVVTDDYSVFGSSKPIRQNPPIVPGHLRSISAALTFDSRRLLKRKRRDFYLLTWPYTRITVGAERSRPSTIASDFDFFRYAIRLHREQRTFSLGLTSVDAYAGASTGDLPPQRYFTVDFGNEVFFAQGGFNTMAERNFAGNRAAYVFLTHDFDQQLFRQSRIPLVKHLPFTLSVHGGAFWTDFVGHTINPGDEAVLTAPSAYTEVGFGIGNLTPWLTPFNFSIWFTWQLSSYATDGFEISFGIPGLGPGGG